MSDENETIRRCMALMVEDYQRLVEDWHDSAACMASSVFNKCESPIEKLMAAAMAFGLQHPSDLTCKVIPPFWRMNRHDYLLVEPQKEIGRYRVDFAVTDSYQPAEGTLIEVRIVVECDGHAFHEKTPAQAHRDKARDRALTELGWSVMRFTGSEIVRDPRACVRQIRDTIQAARDRQWALMWRAESGEDD